MSFLVKLFTTKGNLVIMNNFYHKVAIASICTALSFTLVTNKEAKAATFNLTGTSFSVSREGSYVGSGSVEGGTFAGTPIIDRPETRAFYEFDISNLSLAPNTIIRSAILNTPFINLEIVYRFLDLDLYGYVGNGRADLLDFNAGVKIAQGSAVRYYPYYPHFLPFGEIDFDVTDFVKERVSNGDDFAGLGIRVGSIDYISYPNAGSLDLRSYDGQEPTLTIETEPVPEPTTIFGSALALSVGWCLKRKKSSQQNKTRSQH
jgi:hypothetical protein